MTTVRRLHTIAVSVEPDHLLKGWRAEAGAVFLPALAHASLGDPVAVRVGLAGLSVRATLFGTVTLVRRSGGPLLPRGVEVSLDEVGLRAARFLLAAARGEPVAFREREQRHVLERPLVARWRGTSCPMRTLDVSRRGCSVVWVGPLPEEGEVLQIELARWLFFSRRVDAVVRWRQAANGRASMGLRLSSRGRGFSAWRELASQAARRARCTR